MIKRVSRRSFLKGLGLGASGALLANAGLPAFAATDRRAVEAVLAQSSTVGQARQTVSPNVELMIGDVVGFELDANGRWDGGFGSVTFQMNKAYYDGGEVYYIRTDASDQAYAEENHLVWVPLLTTILGSDAAAKNVYF